MSTRENIRLIARAPFLIRSTFHSRGFGTATCSYNDMMVCLVCGLTSQSTAAMVMLRWSVNLTHFFPGQFYTKQLTSTQYRYFHV